MKYLSLLLLLLLVACQQASIPDTSVFTPDNSFNQPTPDATMINSDDFAKQIKDGSLILISSKDIEAQLQSRETTYRANLEVLKKLPQNAQLEKLLEVANSSKTPHSETTLSTQGIQLLSLSQRIGQATTIQEQAQSPENALRVYEELYALLPDALKTALPSISALKGKSLADIQAAIALLNNGLDSSLAQFENIQAAPALLMPNVAAGNGHDQYGSCNPTMLYRYFDWPLKHFLSPVKEQGKRGSCWAFTTTSALESRELVQRDAVHNLSEQFLINRVKQDWDDDDYDDGYRYSWALDDMLDNQQVLPEEAFWTYNPSFGRNPTGGTSDTAKYQDSGVMYRNGDTKTLYSGTYSDTSHQSQRICTTHFGVKFCAYERVRYQGQGVAASESVQIWSSGDRFYLNNFRYLLAQGYTIMASFDVRIGFQKPEQGFVTDFRDVYEEDGVEKSGDLGGHAVLIVGFIDNESISAFRDAGGFPLKIPGGLPKSGGFFVVKNSWGCDFGDGGYVYIPAEYIERYFYDLSILHLDTTRSPKWQSYNGGGALQIHLPEGPSINADLRISKKLFEVSPPKNNSIAEVSITVDSSIAGDQFTRSDFFNTASYTSSFFTLGLRTLQITAKLGPTTVKQNLVVNVINAAPSIELISPNVIYAGEKTTLSVTLKDKNEANPGGMCKRLEWFFSAPDVPYGNDGVCSRVIAFGQAGQRSFTLSTTDSEGLRTNQTFTVNVQPAPVNPYPRITEAWLHEPNRLIGNDVDAFCEIGARIPDGNLIDFRKPESSYACGGSSEEPTQTRPYEVSVGVENPEEKLLSYEWIVWEGTPNNILISELGDSTYPIPYYALGFGGTPFNCGVMVEVSYEVQFGRSVKTQNVWSGQCVFPDVVPR